MRFEPIRIYFSDLRSSAGVRQARMNYRVYSGCTQATQRAAGTAMASAMLDRLWFKRRSEFLSVLNPILINSKVGAAQNSFDISLMFDELGSKFCIRFGAWGERCLHETGFKEDWYWYWKHDEEKTHICMILDYIFYRLIRTRSLLGISGINNSKYGLKEVFRKQCLSCDRLSN